MNVVVAMNADGRAVRVAGALVAHVADPDDARSTSAVGRPEAGRHRTALKFVAHNGDVVDDAIAFGTDEQQPPRADPVAADLHAGNRVLGHVRLEVDRRTTYVVDAVVDDVDVEPVRHRDALAPVRVHQVVANRDRRRLVIAPRAPVTDVDEVAVDVSDLVAHDVDALPAQHVDPVLRLVVRVVRVLTRTRIRVRTDDPEPLHDDVKAFVELELRTLTQG